MDRLQRAAVLTCLIRELREHGSWCGETHVQKASLFLQELLSVPLGFEFILYKHGPFSFDLRDELTSYRADGFVELEPQWPYGPRINSTDQSAYVQRSFAKTVAQYESCIEFVAEKLGSKGVAELERLATALFVTLHRNPNSPMQDRAEHLSRIKPHVSLDDATVAVACVDQIIAEAQTGSCTTAR